MIRNWGVYFWKLKHWSASVRRVNLKGKLPGEAVCFEKIAREHTGHLDNLLPFHQK